MGEKRIVLELNNISKYFPGVKALDQVNLTLREGEVLGLCGENGAGKSTLIKVVTGVIQSDGGEMLIYGKPERFATPHQAFAAGISAVHQERNLISTFNVAENVLLERMTLKAGNIIHMDKLVEEAKKYLEFVKLDVDPLQNVEELSAAQKQILEIARALSMNAKIVLLDEPTASISVKDSELLIKTVRELAEQGYSFIYVSHKLDEIFEVCDCVNVIRDGKNAGGQKRIQEITKDELITLMVGRRERTNVFEARNFGDKPVILEACGICSKYNPTPNSFVLHKGEILGWYGLVGSGRTELAREIVGLDPVTGGQLMLNGQPIKCDSAKTALETARIAYVSENRNEEGLFLIHSIARNISSSVWKRLATAGFVKKAKETELGEEYTGQLAIKTPSQEQMVINLSGGNRQKVSIGKVLATDPQILLFDEPTVGIDIKTKSEIHKLIWDLSLQGISIILISSDMPELISLADRILVFSGGSICKDFVSSKQYDEVSTIIMETIISGKEEVS